MNSIDLRRRSTGAIAAAAVAVTLIGCGSARDNTAATTPSSTSTTSHRSGPRTIGTPTAHPHPARPSKPPTHARTQAPASRPPAVHAPPTHAESERHFLRSFGVAYARFLSGGPAPAALSPAARRQLGPPPKTHIRPRLKGVRSQHADAAAIVLAAGGRSFTVPLTVQLRGAHWSVVTVTPPDLDQAAAPPAPTPIAPPAGARQPAAAARAFLAGYLRLANGHGSVAQLQSVTPALRADLRAHPLAVANDGTLRLAHLGMVGADPRWTAEPLITNGQTTFELMLTVVKAATRTCSRHQCHPHRLWVVSAIRSPGR